MKLILQAIKALLRKTENGISRQVDQLVAVLSKTEKQIDQKLEQLKTEIPKTAGDVGALPDTVSALPNPCKLTIYNLNNAGKATYDGSAEKNVFLPVALKNPYAMEIFGKSYDGSAAVSVNQITGTELLVQILRAAQYQTDVQETIRQLFDLWYLKNGIYEEEDGWRWYCAGQPGRLGMNWFSAERYDMWGQLLSDVYDNDLIYVDDAGNVIHGQVYRAGNNWGILPEFDYTFDDEGRLTNRLFFFTANLTNVEITSPSSEYLPEGYVYDVGLRSASGCRLASVTVTMGAEDITETAYVDGRIQIDSVSGDVVITAVAE